MDSDKSFREPHFLQTTAVSKGGFGCCTSLKDVTLPDNILFVDEGAFAECESLSQVNLSSETMFIPQSEEYPSFPETAKINTSKS